MSHRPGAGDQALLSSQQLVCRMSQQSGNLNVLAGSEPIPRYLSGVSAPRMFLPQEQCWAILRKHASGADQAVFQEVAPVWDTRGGANQHKTRSDFS